MSSDVVSCALVSMELGDFFLLYLALLAGAARAFLEDLDLGENMKENQPQLGSVVHVPADFLFFVSSRDVTSHRTVHTVSTRRTRHFHVAMWRSVASTSGGSEDGNLST